MKIAFNKPHLCGDELRYVQEALASGSLAGDGPFSKQCHRWLTETTGAAKALLTHSCTAALEMCTLLLDLQPGDEVILPSHTFVSTANAVVLRGAVPVFVDVREDTLNIDERLVAGAVTKRTKAVCAVHYAGVSCEMDALLEVAGAHGLPVFEDAAQGLHATYRGRPLGSLGALGAYSFHETKNVISGEGGALLVNDARYADRAEILWQKGTNRQAFSRGEVDKYTWVDVGSSFLPGELTAAFLWAQLQKTAEITAARRSVWDRYYAAFEGEEARGVARRPIVPPHCGHNAHMFYLLVEDLEARTRVLARLKERGVHAVFHYVPLHSSPAGQRLGRTHGSMAVTDSASSRLIRLPLWAGMDDAAVAQVISVVHESLA